MPGNFSLGLMVNRLDGCMAIRDEKLYIGVNSNIINLTAAKVLPNRNFSIAFKGNRALFTLFGVNFSSFDRLLRHSKGTVQILFFLEQHLIIYR